MNAEHAVWILLVGLAVIGSTALHAVAHRTRIPGLVGCLLMGLGLHWLDSRYQLLGAEGRTAFAFMADIGLVVILFRVGLHSDVGTLVSKLRPAAAIWFGNVFLSALLGYVTARYLAGLGLADALIIAVALTATSIGVSAAAWEEQAQLTSDDGQLMLSVAELDDISGILLMAVMFAVVPVIAGGNAEVAAALATAGGLFALKFGCLAALCLAAARFLERPLARFAGRLERPPERILPVAGAGFMMAAAAAALGFSLAIGALFAGLLFSRDPAAVRDEARFDDLYAFFAPFFFIGIGLATDFGSISSGWLIGAWLFAAAVLGKFVGGTLPALGQTSVSGALLIGVSMIPRAEIAMVIAHEGWQSGFLTDAAHAALVIVALASCLLAPWLIDLMLSKRPQLPPHQA